MIMPDPTLTDSSHAQIVDCVRRVIGSRNESDCLHAATQLTELGVRTRRSILPRGSPDEPAPNRLPDPALLSELIERFKATAGETRRQLASALGEWGDGRAAVEIRKFLQQSGDPPTQRTCINALMTIGGPEAILGLSWAAKQEPLQRAATWALEELNTGGTLDYSDGTTVGRKGRQRAVAAAATAVRQSEVAPESTSLSLLERLREQPNSTEAWERLDAFYRPLLLRWVVRWGLQDAEAENLTQDVLLEVVRLLPDFRHSGRSGAFRLWLRNILTNRVLAFLRRRRQHPWLFFSEWSRRANTRTLFDELETPDRPLNRLWNEEHDKHVVRQIWSNVAGEFSERDVKAFQLVVEKTMKPADVARYLGISVALVWQIKSRILRRLREEGQGLIDASPKD